ncbi:Putative F0F1-ATPase subunit Ca2+/Mg2+ transporter [Lutibacter agarilyticus]|uniref:Putative F0F1-ATPase subunit Ca2+/Mg2+ transporter n=1 Tax=Lutibacter agarilyticus TaxID=1109740 RepID=A0A238W2Y2_9FLAO|nr:AtpZ/AtpI family protein [Lutibacter agarilyticus]SNR40069.1 Putative F0F1-ATPase subunit Ca2+/Mg2+ transporter [Lutibacter agarilyticus]
MSKNQKKNQLHKYLALTGIAFQMGITIYLGAYFGKKLDAHFETTKTYTLILTLLSLLIALWSVLAQLKKINDKYDKSGT